MTAPTGEHHPVISQGGGCHGRFEYRLDLRLAAQGLLQCHGAASAAGARARGHDDQACALLRRVSALQRRYPELDRLPSASQCARRRHPSGRRRDLLHTGIQFLLPGGLKNAIDWVSRLPNQPFAGKPVALQSASPGPVGGARVQYDLRKAMMFLDAFTLNKPEIFVGNCASKLDETTGEIKDETTRGFIKQQLA